MPLHRSRQQSGVSNRGRKEGHQMMQLDAQLLLDTRRLINSVNGQRLKEMIFAYEQAVDLHNRQYPGHEVYRMRSEVRLRGYVLDCVIADIRQVSATAIECATR